MSNCGRCQFAGNPNQLGNVECHRFPPTGRANRWPLMTVIDWCGEWSAAAGDALSTLAPSAEAAPDEDAVKELAFRCQDFMAQHLTVDPADGEIMGVGQSSFAIARHVLASAEAAQPVAWHVEYNGTVLNVFTNPLLISARKSSFPYATIRPVFYSQPQGELREGMVLVPREPTEAMLRADAGTSTTDSKRWKAAMWRAMIDAALAGRTAG